jgi:hypothetical protein
VVRGLKDHDRPLQFERDRHCKIRRDPGLLDQRTGEQRSSDVKETRVKFTNVRFRWRVRSMDKRHCGEPNCMGVNFPRRSHNPNYSFIEWLHVIIRRIAG